MLIAFWADIVVGIKELYESEEMGSEGPTEDECDNDVISRLQEVEFCNKRSWGVASEFNDRIRFAVAVGVLSGDATPEKYCGMPAHQISYTSDADAQALTLRSLKYPVRMAKQSKSRFASMQKTTRNRSFVEE